MLRTPVNKFTFAIESPKSDDFYGNIIDKNVLSIAYPGTRDVQMLYDTAMEKVSTAMPSLVKQRTPFADHLRKRTIFVDAPYVEWTLLNNGYQEAQSVENLHSGEECVGLYAEEFEVKLNVGYWGETDILTTTVNQNYLVRVASDPQPHGDGWVYSVQLLSSNPANEYFPPELLEPNIGWIKVHSVASQDGSNKYGTYTNESMGYLKYRVPMSSHSQEGLMSGEAERTVLTIDVQGERAKIMEKAGLLPRYIFPLTHMNFLKEFDYSVEKALLLGRMSDNVILDKSVNKPIKTGPGLFEYFEESNVWDYSSQDKIIPKIQDACDAIAYDKIPWEQRKWHVKTGLDGLRKASDEIRDYYNNIGYKQPYSEDVTNTASTVPTFRAKGFSQPYFNQITIPLFGTLVFEYWPMLDGEDIFRVKNPETGHTLASSYYFIFDWGNGDSESSNIQLLKRKGEIDTFVNGTWSAAGPIDRSNGRGFTSSHSGRYFTWHREVYFGLRMKDTSRGIWLRRNIC